MKAGFNINCPLSLDEANEIQETIGGQITSYEANKEKLPGFLERPVKESFKKYGFCMWKTPEYECIIYPTLQAAQHAIQWTIEN